MNAKKNPDEFLTINSLKTLGGSSTAVWLTSGVIAFIFSKCDPYPDWLKLIALILAVVISIGITVSKKKKMAKYYVIALLNGLLIFSTATGYNTIHNEFSRSGGCDDSTKGTGLNSIFGGVYLSSIFSFDKPWFLPKRLVEENETLVKEKERLIISRDSLVSINKKLTEEVELLPKNEKDFKNKLDTLNNALNNSLKENTGLKRDIEELKNSINKRTGESEDYKNKFLRLQSDYNTLQGRFDKLTKDCAGYDKLKSDYEKLKSEYEKLKNDCADLVSIKRSYQRLQSEFNQLKSDCAGYDKLKSDYEKLQSEYNRLKSDCAGYDKMKASNENLQNKLEDCEKKLQDCQRQIIK